MFLHVVEARYVRDHTVWLRFYDGTSGEVDLGGELEGPVFGPLRDLDKFQRFTVAYHTLAWGNGTDFAPEFFVSTYGSPFDPGSVLPPVSHFSLSTSRAARFRDSRMAITGRGPFRWRESSP